MAPIFMMARAESLTNTLFSLNEPWKSRFLDLMANRVGHKAEDKPIPTPGEVTTWLSDTDLYQEIARLLRTWHGARI